MPSDLELLSTLVGSNYSCLELIFMVPKVFEPLKFDCTFLPYASFQLLMPDYTEHFCCSVSGEKLR